MQKPKWKKPRNLLFFEANTLAQTWFAEHRSRDPLPKYYSDNNLLQPRRTRAGSSSPILQYSNTPTLLGSPSRKRRLTLATLSEA